MAAVVWGCIALSIYEQTNAQPAAKQGFAIYGTALPSQWTGAPRKQTEPPPRALVEDKDIEAYDWDNQAIILSDQASKRITEDTISGDFFVVVNGARLFEGEGLHRFSARMVDHPVLYAVSKQGRTVLLIRPSHDFQAKPQLEDKAWSRIASPELMNHFKQVGKLRRPWSEKSYTDLTKSMYRIKDLKLLETPAALQAQYDLIGTDNGNYVVQEFLRWNVGNEGRSFGPSYKNQVALGSQPAVHRVASFPYSELARRYKNNKPYLPANEGKVPEWVVTVSVAPDNRGRTLDLVARINLELTMQYDGELPGSSEHRVATHWWPSTDMKVSRIPVKWNLIESAPQH